MQNSTVQWLSIALEDLHEIVVYLAKEDRELAQEIAQHIWDTGQSLKLMPSRGRPGRVAGTRELVLTAYPYFIAYRVRQGKVQILRVRHTSRQYPS